MGMNVMNTYIEYFIGIATIMTLVACAGWWCWWIVFVPSGVDRRN